MISSDIKYMSDEIIRGKGRVPIVFLQMTSERMNRLLEKYRRDNHFPIISNEWESRTYFKYDDKDFPSIKFISLESKTRLKYNSKTNSVTVYEKHNIISFIKSKFNKLRKLLTNWMY